MCNQWIAVTDKLPWLDCWVLVYAHGAMNCMAYYDGQWRDWVGMTMSNIVISEITHWMPLPKPPEGMLR